MSLSVGIVGLPNAGKSTLFNALASRRLAETAARPFTTIDPNEVVVAVPDGKLERLWELVVNDKTKPTKIPATVTFIDIAGLVKGAHKGEGLGNQFLAKIREVDAIVHVVRAFSDENVSHSHPSHEPGSEKQIIEDIEIINLELELGGIEKKPTVIILNCQEDEIDDISSYHTKIKENFSDEVITISAKLEEELIDLEEEERKEYMQALGIRQEALDKLIRKAYEMLDLITFYTIKGGKEISAFSLPKKKSALDAAERVHTDFARNFIKAEVITVDRLLEIGELASTKRGGGAWKEAKEKGLIRLEGKDYIVQDKDVIEFKVGK